MVQVLIRVLVVSTIMFVDKAPEGLTIALLVLVKVLDQDRNLQELPELCCGRTKNDKQSYGEKLSHDTNLNILKTLPL